MRLNLTLERETKHTVRFAEDDDGQPEGHPGPPVMGTCYVQKFAWAQMGKPEHVVIAIEALVARH